MKRLLQVAFILFIAVIAALAQERRAIQFEDMWAMGRVRDAQVSPDGKWVAYTVTVYNVEQNKGNADLHLVSMDGKIHKQLTFNPAMDYHPRWISATRLAFLSTRDGSPQIYLLDLHGGEAEKLTDIPTGIGSFEWAPDGRHILISTSIYPEAKTPQESKALEAEKKKDKATGRIIDGLLYRHWNHWREGKYSHVFLLDAQGNVIRDLTPGKYDTPPISLGSSHDFVWSADGQSIAFVRNTDPVVAISTNNDVWVTNLKNPKLVQKISVSKGNDNGPRFSPNGRYIAFLSMKRAGFESDQQDLVIYDRKTGKLRNLTETLDRYVSDFVWSPNSRYLYFYTPWHGRHQIYRVDVRNGKIRRLLDGHYINSIAITPDGKSLVLARQAVNYPTELYRFDLRKRRLHQLTFTNKDLLAELEMNPLEDYWFIGANGDSVHLLMVKPPFFDPKKKYPLLSLIHGGPQGAWGDDFHYRWNAEMFASPGYVVIMINFHGSRGYGQAFCDAVSHRWGSWPYEDIMKGTKWAIEHFDFIDGNRVGAAGASYGGFMINWIEGHNDEKLFKVLVNHDGVFEQVSMFGATEELWFPIWEFNGRPWDDGSLYQKWNPANFVTHFKTPMLLIHGEKDFRVPYTQALQAFTALQLQGVESRLLIFPDEDHFVLKPQNARLWWKTVYDWLGKYLKP